MKNRLEFDGNVLPPELAELDAELSSITFEERPSFGPELEAELEREWARLRGRPRIPYRQLAAAGVTGVLMIGLGVPSARASLVRLFGSLMPEALEVADLDAPSPTPLFYEAPALPDEDRVEPPALVPSDPPPAPDVTIAYPGPEAVFPEILDREEVEALILGNYPTELQRAGIGGTVRLRLWVDTTGAVEFVNVARGSGIRELDVAAMQVAPSFRFAPARRRGAAVETWVEFDVRFEAPPQLEHEGAPANPDPVDEPAVPEALDMTMIPEWTGDVVLQAPIQREAGELLRAAVGDADELARFGPIESVLGGEPPEGVAPTGWRRGVGELLENAMIRDPDNPVPLLALARIRRKQGLRTEARILFERGLERAIRAGDAVSPTVLAALHYERGTLIKEAWLGSRHLGRVPAEALPLGSCTQARTSGGATSGFASSDRLIAWNYLCPSELNDALDASFEPNDTEAQRDYAIMMSAFGSAIEAYPAHVGANLEVLLALADERRWDDVLDGARRFIWASRGHPYGLLMSGLALQRLARTEDAEGQFELASRGLPSHEVRDLEDVRALLVEDQVEGYVNAQGSGRGEWLDDFWAPLDPILTTEVNERRVEHLARASYAHLRFGSAATDPGQVWVRYGRPRSIRAVSGAGGVRTEFWDYGRGPDITFRRLASSLDMDLTSEGKAYVDELRHVLPHRYGTESRTVFTLPGQLSRFRGLESGLTEVEVYTEVPPLLATGTRDTLDLGFFLLDGQGDAVASTRRRILAQQAPVALEAPAPDTVASVVVEVFNRATGQAAAMREPVAMPAGGVASISDLLITRVAVPRAGDVRRRADWLEPETLAGPVGADAVGVLFELYDAARISSWYRLRAEVQNAETGKIRGVPIRPAGEDGFRATWDRYPAAEGVTSEFVSVALSDVPPGRYVLRVVVDLPDGDVPLVAQRALERR